VSAERPPITGRTKVLALLGRPIGHALSPVIHNAALEAAGADAVFVALSPTPEHLGEAVRGLFAAGCAGLSITIPFKTAVIGLVDELGPSAAETGAANTIVIGADGRLAAHNTDVDGARRCLDVLPDRRRGHGVLLGAGGAARAAATALARAGLAQLTILNRTPAKAEALADELAGAPIALATGAVDAGSLAHHLEAADLLVNTTSRGMYPDDEATPVPADLLRPDLDVIDAVYRPNPSRLCRDARAAGASAVTGIDWIIAQGAVALKYWLGIDADESAMGAALDRYFSYHRN
jgi:shikimate dehydrogenase